VTGNSVEPKRNQRATAGPSSMNSIYRRRRLAAGGIGVVFAVGFAVLLGWVVGGSSGSSGTSGSSPAPISSLSATTTSSTVSSTPSSSTTTTTDPGLLPQTSEIPPTDVASISRRMAPLWAAMKTDSLPVGMTVFFPKSAYQQVKAGILSNPVGDYQNRLVALYGMDLNTYNAALGIPPASALLAGFAVEPSLVHWVAPGACTNAIGYWHLPNIRISYSSRGSVSSFGVFSLISWRGVWYVVHLGPVPRTSGTGVLDLPANGQGTPGPGGGC